MGDSPITNTIKNVAGYGVGTLAALDTIKGGGLGSYLMNRQRLMSDPGFRSTLAGSPFAAGVFGVSGATGAAPAPAPPGAYPSTGAGGGGVVQPADMVGPPPPGVQVAQPGMPVPSAQTVLGYEPGTARAWMPNLPPYDPEQALKQQGFATSQIGLGSPDEGVRAQSKMAAGIPLTDPEMAAAVSRGRFIQSQLGPGGVVKLDIPGMTSTIGSPYTSIGTEEYPTYGAAEAAGAATGRKPMPSGRGTWILAPLPTQQQQLPTDLPTPKPAGTPAQPTQPAAQPAAQPAQPTQPAAQPVTPPRVAAVEPPPPPAAAASPSEPPMRGAVAPNIYATPGKAPAYVPPGVPAMAPSVPVAPGSPPSGQIGFPSAAFDDTSAATPAPPPAPPPAQPLAMYARPVAASGGSVDLNAPWLRQIEAARKIPAGVLSGMAEKESGGNALKVNPAPNSTAAGLFQITAPTAQAWGLSPADRFDPVKAATATADALAQRAQAVGIERAVGMHYGGPGTPYTQVVGSSGLSPAAYSGDVLARAQKYSGATDGTVGYPSPAPTPAAPPTPVDYRGVPFRLKEPDLRPATLGVAPPPTPGMPFDIGAPVRPAGLPAIAGPPVDPESGVPLKTITERDQHGKEISYSVPDLAGAEVAANMARAGISDWRTVPPDDPRITYFQQLQAATAQRQKLMEADIAQARGPGNAGMKTVLNMYNGYRMALNTYLKDFPTPEDRAPYVGYLNLPLHAIKALAVGDPRFKQFLADTSAFQYHKIDELKGDLSEQEQTMLGDSLPTGHESDAASHEMRLANFNNLVNDRKAMLTAEVTMSPDQLGDPAWWNAANQAVMDMHDADKAAAGGGLGGAYVGAALGAPEATPPEAPPSTVPMGTPPPNVAPPPFTVLGQWQE